MTDRNAWFQLNRFGDEGYERLLFADLVEPSPVSELLPSQLDVPLPWPSDVTFELHGDGIEDVPFQVWGFVLVSERLKQAINDADLAGITFCPVRTISKISRPAPRYWYGHLAHVTSAIDFEKSLYAEGQYENDKFLIMGKFALRRDVIKEWDFFRCAESDAAQFCSNRFRDLFLKHKFTGLGFIPVPVS